jgi:hypothetical protein
MFEREGFDKVATTGAGWARTALDGSTRWWLISMRENTIST